MEKVSNRQLTGIIVKIIVVGILMSDGANRSMQDAWLATLFACVLAVPVAVWLSERYLQDFNYRISNYGWIFAVAVIISLAIAFGTVLWQTLKAAKTNPAVELKKE